MATTPTKRTLDWCREMGWLADVSEKWVNSAGVNQLVASVKNGMGIPKWCRQGKGLINTGTRRDLFGFIDVVCLRRGEGIVAIQCTSEQNISARVRKIQTECSEAAEFWLDSGGLIEVWGWRNNELAAEVQFAEKTTKRKWRPKITSFAIDSSDMPF